MQSRRHARDCDVRMNRPLDGITVVSLEQAVAAPFATRQLADLGARVIKIERPGKGDFARYYDETVHGMSSYFVWLNRSKESVTLDVAKPEGREIVTRLLSTADVFVQNLRPGSSSRLGLSAAALREVSNLIVCDVVGFGQDGPWADRKAYDLLIQAETGLMALTGVADHPARVGISVADIAAGMYAFSGILAALYDRDRTGRARSVHVTLFDALAEWMGAPENYARYSGRQPDRMGTHHSTIAPYGAFALADSASIVVVTQNDTEWVSLCTNVLGAPELARDDRFGQTSARVANRDLLNEMISKRLMQLTFAQAAELLDSAGLGYARMNAAGNLLDHPSMQGRNRARVVDSPRGSFEAMIPPISMEGTEPRMDAVPALGAHTERVLTELGLDEAAIAALRAGDVI